jgi:hypothetical protein
MDFCSKCGAWMGAGSNHRCPPRFLCRELGHTEWKKFQAHRAEAAAESFAEQQDRQFGEGPTEHAVEVRQEDSGETWVFDVGFEFRAQYEASERLTS